MKIEWTRYEHGRHPITVGEDKMSTTLQEQENAEHAARPIIKWGDGKKVNFKADDLVESIEKD